MASAALVASAAPMSAATATTTAEREPTTIEVIDSGQTDEGGWVEFTGEGEVTIDESTDHGGPTTKGTQNVGGGTWSYGAGARINGQKTCRSEYYHRTVNHGSSVSMGGSRDSDYVSAGRTSYAYVAKYTTATCRAYWRK